ncbi:uncharacterized protein LOC118410315 isoform X2 [Branchiostoma floridae]|uniref:Uncharacterized protein LOC118410315 isoform X2 n=1 Tax=Branchiostoma floridae TaxID=7739 RepID=A0A9J7KPM4_BRAFL|nr:uncharacterized protein LOC118410315 isoform X2 [Branchiostoma floridae]
MEVEECREYGYSLVRTIAAGRFGDIKQATIMDSMPTRRGHGLGHTRHQQDIHVAVKIYNKGKPNYELFQREADMLQKLEHPHVMYVHQCFFTIDRAYLVMEYCGMNGRLGEFIQQYRAGRGVGLAEDVVRHFTLQLVDGMKYVHKRGIVHRDLTADNVLLDDKYNLKITGFNYATQLEKGCELVSRNEPNFLENMKTSALEYTPPEILCQEEYLGKPADVWSMGVVFYMMVAGEKPFIAPPHEFPLVRVDLYAKEICERQPIYDNFMVSKEAKRLARKLLQLDPAKRPTLRQLRGSLSNWVYLALGPNQVENIARAHKRKYEKLENIARAHKRKYQQQGRAEKGETVAGDQGETDPEPLFIHRTYDFMEETPAPLRSTPELVHRRYSDKCEALIINRTKPRDAEDNVNTRKVDDDASHADSDRSGNVDADLSAGKRRGRDASHADSDRSGNVDADLSTRKRRGRDASHADRSGKVDADLSARKRRGRDASHADRSGNVDADLSAHKRRGRDASHAESDRSGNVDADSSAHKRRGRRLVFMTQKGVENLMERNTFAPKPPSERKCAVADEVAPPSGHHPSSQMTQKDIGDLGAGFVPKPPQGKKSAGVAAPQSGQHPSSQMTRTQKDIGDLGADFVPKPPPGKKSVGVAAPPSGQPQSSRAQIRKRERMESVSKREKGGELPANKTSRFRAPIPSPGLTPPPECLDQVEPDGDCKPSYLEGSGLSVKLLSDGRKRIPMTKKDVGGTGPVPKPPPGKKSAGVAAPQSGQLQSSRAQTRKREGRVPQESVSKREKGGELPANKTSRFRAHIPSPCLTPPPECLTQVEPEDSELMYQGGCGSTMKLSPGTAGMVRPPYGQRPSSRAQIRKKERMESGSKREEDGTLTANKTFRFQARVPSPDLTPPPECLDLEPNEDERKTAPMTQKSIDSLTDATTFTPKPPPRKKSTAAGMVARPSGQHQSSQASRAQITLKHRRVISPNGPTENVKSSKGGSQVAHSTTFRWHSERPSPCLTPPPECLVQEEPADGVLGDSGPSLKRSTPMGSQRHPDVGPREEERGDGEDGSERRSNIRGTKSRSDRDMKRTSRKSEGDVRSAMKRTEANVSQRMDDSSTRKRGKSRSQRHNQDGAEADVDGGHALRKTSGRVLLPPVDAKQKKRLDGRARLPPINRRS